MPFLRHTERIHCPERYKLSARPCSVCGEEFTPLRSDAKYCSQVCRNRNRSVEKSAEIAILNKMYYQKFKTERKNVMYRESAVIRKYGLSIAQYDALLSASPVCALCGEPFSDEKRSMGPVLDHNHSTGEIRAFIHGGCNTGIGQLGDSSEMMLKAAKYLKRYGA